MLICGAGTVEVTMNRFRHAVNLEQKTYSCRAWQVTGKPYTHALAFIAKLIRHVYIDEFVDDYFSADKFRKAYSGTFNPMTSKDSWARVDLGYKIKKPKFKRKPVRPRVSRMKSYDEAGTSKKRKIAKDCHIAKHCQGGLTASQKRKLSISQNESSSQTLA